MVLLILLKIVLMLCATLGMIVPAAIATKPAISEYSTRSCPRVSFQIEGFFVSGKKTTEDSHGIWLSRTLGKGTAEMMVPWRFIHVAWTASDEQVKKFGFDKLEERVPVEVAAKELPA
jgi:hypothetical protein